MRKQFFLFLLLLAIAAYGQQQERVAILNTVDDSDSIRFSDLSYLTDRLRETAVNILPKQQFGVMTTESIVAFLGSQETAMKVCREASCLADVGRKVNADYVAQARIGRFGEDLTIKTELYSTRSGNLIGSFTGDSKNIYGLRAIVDEKAPDLFRKMLEAQSKERPASPPAVATSQQETNTEVAEPYEPPKELPLDSPDKLQLGIRGGINAPYIGMQLGFVLDFAVSKWFHLQPGLMYINHNMDDADHLSRHLELPLLLSLKYSVFNGFALRGNAGPYFGMCIGGECPGTTDIVFNLGIGFNLGMGFDIWKFYIGAFASQCFVNLNIDEYTLNTPLGINVGINFPLGK